MPARPVLAPVAANAPEPLLVGGFVMGVAAGFVTFVERWLPPYR